MKQLSKTKNFQIILISALYVCIQLIVFFASELNRCSLEVDSLSYIRSAETIIDGSFFAKEASFFRTPGYPLLIVLSKIAGDQFINALVCFQILLSGISLFMIWQIIIDMTSNKKYALVGALLFILHFHQAFYNTQVMTEAVFIPLLVFTYYFFNKWYNEKKMKHWLVFSILINVALWVRPVLLIFVFILIAIILVRVLLHKMKISHLIVFTLFLVLFSGSWIVRNYYVAGTFSYSSVASVNMGKYRKGMVDASIKYPGIKYYSYNNHVSHDENLRFFSDNYPGFYNMPETVQSKILMKEGLATIYAHPSKYALIHLESMLWLIYSSEQYQVNVSMDSLGYDRTGRWSSLKRSFANNDFYEILNSISLSSFILWNYFSRPYNGVLWALFIIGFLLSWRKLKMPHWFAFGLIMYFWTISGPESFLASRLRMPMEPFIVILLVVFYQWLSLRKQSDANVPD